MLTLLPGVSPFNRQPEYYIRHEKKRVEYLSSLSPGLNILCGWKIAQAFGFHPCKVRRPGDEAKYLSKHTNHNVTPPVKK